MIPAEAVEAAAIAMSECGAAGWEDQGLHFQGVMRRDARLALEAAAPYMLRHEREQTRLAHLDAMVNRETKREELAEAWARGHHDGAVDQMLHMENGGAKTTTNPYMLNTEGEK